MNIILHLLLLHIYYYSILFQVVSEPKMLVHKGRTVMVFEMQLNVNLKIMKREEHEGRCVVMIDVW